jgi:outer membrane protein OmpA-like peptidoglycan-associated protein
MADLQVKLDRARIFYNEGSITVTASEMDSVYLLAAEAARCDGALLQVVGQHSDAVGSREGPATGRLRALAIMNTLVSAGFAADEIIVTAPSWSESIAGQPALPNSRVDFTLVDVRG